MNPLMLTLSLFYGLIPFNRLSTSTTFLLDYGLMVVVPIFYLTCYGLALFGTFGLNQLDICDSICRLASTLFMHLGCFLYVTIYSLTLKRRKAFFVKFGERLKEIDGILQKCQQQIDNTKKVQGVRHTFYITWLVVALIFGYALFYDGHQMIDIYHNYFFVSNMVTSFPFFAGSVVQGQFIYFVSVISNRFGEINHLFERINQECDKKNAQITIFDIENNIKNTKKSKGPIIIQELGLTDEKNVLESELSDFSSDENNASTIAADVHTSETNLPELFKLHDKVLSLGVITNAEFGPQSVPYMTACFVISIFGIFLQTKVIFIVGGKNRLLDYVAFIYVIWSLIMMIVAYLVLRLCCNANSHSKQSAMIVHEIMQKKPAFMLGNDLYYNKMKSFTLQYLHWESYFQFNGIGLFALDYTFIFSTVSAATSYLIVLLQFDMSTILRAEGLL